MEKDFSFAGRDFKLNKIDAFKQFHIVRRIAPILSELLPAMKMGPSLKKVEELSESAKLDAIAKFATPIMKGLSELSDEDADLVLLGLLQSVEVKQSTGNWAKIANGPNLMIQDLELPQLLQIAGRAFMFNLSSFFSGLLQ